MKKLTKGFLKKEYTKNKKSIQQIAKEMVCSQNTIWRHLKKYKIKIRTISEANKGKKSFLYIDGRTLKKYYCLDCGKKLSGYRAKRCGSCNNKNRNKGIKNGNYGKKHPGLNKGIKNPMFGKDCPSKVNNYKGSYYKEIWMRSSWEVAIAYWLDLSGIKWLYESKTFDLGNTTYTPDFYLPEFDCYIEIKGYWRDDAKNKFKLFKKRYPNIKIQILMEKDLKKLGVL